jgi:hypothetical protein
MTNPIDNSCFSEILLRTSKTYMASSLVGKIIRAPVPSRAVNLLT